MVEISKKSRRWCGNRRQMRPRRISGLRHVFGSDPQYQYNAVAIAQGRIMILICLSSDTIVDIKLAKIFSNYYRYR